MTPGGFSLFAPGSWFVSGSCPAVTDQHLAAPVPAPGAALAPRLVAFRLAILPTHRDGPTS